MTVVLARGLAQRDDIDLHVLTLEGGRRGTTVQSDGKVTIHRLGGSRWMQILDILVGPGRRRLLRHLDDLRPDLLHCHETYGLAMGGRKLPHVFTVHGFDHANVVADMAPHWRVRSWLWRCVERWGLKRQQHVISITPYVRRMIEGRTRAEIHDIENPIDPCFFDVRPRPRPGRILCVGWINERKNTLGSVKALAAVAPSIPQAHLVLAGVEQDPAYRRRVEEAIDEAGLAGRVEFLGHIGHAALPAELAQAEAFLLPSRQENSPMAIAEAMAVGVPVIAANRCGMPYMVEEGSTGFLVDPEDTAMIADRLTRLLTDGGLRSDMAAAGRQAARQRFHPDLIAQRTVEVYRRAVGR
ncbi:MAG: glycosyltransferase family 4 protein [Planctomycetes bacterium]|nr:glycosyltransferase family 4 protein [Planctomycetota bacterium]